MENKEIKEVKKEVQLEEVTGGGMGSDVDRICDRCGRVHYNFYGLCDQCKEETKVITVENGAYGGW